MLSVIMLSIIMLSVIMLSAVMLSVIMLSVVAPSDEQVRQIELKFIEGIIKTHHRKIISIE